MVTITKTMADFPPNPEDGELWLPSFIIHEITTPQNAAVYPSHPTTNHRIIINPTAFTSNFEICFGSFGAKSITAANKLAPAPAHSPVTSVQDQGMAVAEKYGGTGVFLPRSMNIGGGSDAAAEKTEETSGGTGVFLNHQASVTCQKKKKSGKEEKTLRSNNKKKRCSIKEDILGTQENSQRPCEICLPKDWTY